MNGHLDFNAVAHRETVLFEFSQTANRVNQDIVTDLVQNTSRDDLVRMGAISLLAVELKDSGA